MAALALGWGGTGAALAADPPARLARPAMHGGATPSPAPEHSGHDMSDMTDTTDMTDMTEEEMAEHGGTPDPVSSGTRTAVLGGFAAVNAGVLGGALLLRRHDRRHPRRAPRAGRAVR